MEPNRLKCGKCKLFRTIEEYPLDRHGYRTSTCNSCTNGLTDRRANDVLQRGQREKLARAKEQRVKQSWQKMKEEFRSLLQSEEEARAAWEAQMQFKWRNNIFWPPWLDEDEETAKKNWDLQQAKVEERRIKESWKRMREEYRSVQTEEQAKRAWESQIQFQAENDIFWPPWDERFEEEARAQWNTRKEAQRVKESWQRMREQYRSVQTEEQAKRAWESQIQFQAENNIFWPPWDVRYEDEAKANCDALKAAEGESRLAGHSEHPRAGTSNQVDGPAQAPAPVIHKVDQRPGDLPLQKPSEPQHSPPQEPYDPQDSYEPQDSPSPEPSEPQGPPSQELSEPRAQGPQNEEELPSKVCHGCAVSRKPSCFQGTLTTCNLCRQIKKRSKMKKREERHKARLQSQTVAPEEMNQARKIAVSQIFQNRDGELFTKGPPGQAGALKSIK